MGRYDDEDEIMDNDDEPVRRPRSVEPKLKAVDDEASDDDEPLTVRTIKRGWGAADSIIHADSPYAQRLKVDDDPVIVKFLEDDPYAVFRQHWIERPGQKSFTCIADLSSKGCPLCDAGSRPSSRFNFNFLLITEDGEHAIKSYEVGARVIDQLKNFSVDPRQGPLSRHYWAISRSGKGARASTNHQMIRDRDLEEYGLTELSESDLKKFRSQAYDSSIIQIPAYKDLLEIAREDMDD
jgi:hypothetical protein